MARTKRLAILAMTLLVLGGCGGSATTPAASAATTQQPSVVATPAPTPSPAASPSPSQPPAANPSPDVAFLAPQYAALASKGDAALVLCGKVKTAAEGSLAKSKAAAQECLNSYSGYVADMKAINWGPVQPQANRVIDAINKLDVIMVRMAKATSAEALRAAYDQLRPAGAALLVAATALRVALGLPPAHL